MTRAGRDHLAAYARLALALLAAGLCFAPAGVAAEKNRLQATANGQVDLAAEDSATNSYPHPVQSSPSRGQGLRQVFRFSFRDEDGAGDVEWVQAAIGDPSGSASACLVAYMPNDSTHVYLADNTSSRQWKQGTFGSGAAITTEQGMCTLYPAGSGPDVNGNGTDLVLTLDLGFAPDFAGAKGIWLSVKDLSHSAFADAVQMGTWNVQDAASATVELTDLTRAGTDYMVGDNFQLIVNGPPDQAVTVLQTKDGVQGNEFAMGQTDATGNLTINGAWGPQDAGAYTQVWFAGGVRATPDLSFRISPAAPPSVQLTDLMRTGTDYMVGDSFQLIVSGPPGQAVTLLQTKDGVRGNEFPMGQTDATGNLTINGAWGPQDAGAYTQAWFVGGIRATPKLSFRISPKTPAVELTDLMRTGTDYVVGDSFQLVVSGPPSQAVTLLQTKDGVRGNEFPMGQTDATGNLTINGAWGPQDAGAYTQVWFVGGARAAPDLSFRIDPSQPAVVLWNLTRAGTDYFVGDSFELAVGGPSNQRVTVIQTKDGVQGSEAVLGQTNAFGSFWIDGVWGPEDEGSYTQVWFVGGVRATPDLSFRISPAPKAAAATVDH